MENINIFGIIAVIVSVSSFFVAFSQMRIASAKTAYSGEVEQPFRPT